MSKINYGEMTDIEIKKEDVVFYKSFNISYSYTKIDHIDNLSDLENGNITIRFEK